MVSNNTFFTTERVQSFISTPDMEITEIKKAAKIQRSIIQQIAVVCLCVVTLGAYRFIQNKRFEKLFTIKEGSQTDFERAKQLILWGASHTPSTDCLLKLAEKKKIDELTFLFGQIDLGPYTSSGYYDSLPDEWKGAIKQSFIDSEEQSNATKAWNPKYLDILDVWVRYAFKKDSRGVIDTNYEKNFWDKVFEPIARASPPSIYERILIRSFQRGDQDVANIFEKNRCALPDIRFFSPNIFDQKRKKFWNENAKWLETAFGDNYWKRDNFKEFAKFICNTENGVDILLKWKNPITALENIYRILQKEAHWDKSKTLQYNLNSLLKRFRLKQLDNVKDPNTNIITFLIPQDLPPDENTIIYGVSVPPLTLAVLLENLQKMDDFCDMGADVNAKNGVALRDAIQRGKKLEVVEKLLSRGADVDCRNGLPLKEAIHQNNILLVKILLKNNCRIEFKHIELAMKTDNSVILRLILEKFDRSKLKEEQEVALKEFLLQDDARTKRLAEEKSNYEVMQAIQQNNIPLIKDLLEKNCRIEFQHIKSAINTSNSNVLKLILEKFNHSKLTKEQKEELQEFLLQDNARTKRLAEEMSDCQEKSNLITRLISESSDKRESEI